MKYIIITNRGKGDIIRREEFTADYLKQFYPDLDYIFVPFWSWKIPADIYENWEVVMFHMTDLPYGRGGSPLQNLIVRGHTETMITAFKCVEEMDAGPIYMQYPLVLEGTADEIYDNFWDIVDTRMISYILRVRPMPFPQEGKVVNFARWVCTKEDVMRAIDMEYEWVRR